MLALQSLHTILNETPEFTEESKIMATLMATILHHDEPNNIQVEIIKEALQNGQYEIHAEHIANKLLEFSPLVEPAVA